MFKRTRRGSLLFPVTLVFLGVMFLLINLGVVDRTIWSEVVRYWPVLLIFMGIDALLQRSSVGAAFGTIVSATVIIAVWITLFYLFSPDAWITEPQAFRHPLGGATTADIVLSCRDCSMDVDAQSSDSDDLISGSLALRRDERLTETANKDGDRTHFRLESDYRLPFLGSTEREGLSWNVGLTPSIPLSLSVATDGAVNLDLADLLLESADISTGDAQCTITLPLASNATLYLSGSRIEVHVPQSIGVRVAGSASKHLVVPPDYVRTEDGIQSPNYESAPYRTDIMLRPGSEWIEIKPGG